MGDKRNHRSRVMRKRNAPLPSQTVRVSVQLNPDKENNKSTTKSTEISKIKGMQDLAEISTKHVFKVASSQCNPSDQIHYYRNIKHEIDVIENKYYSSNAAVDRIMSRKFRELVGIYLRRQISKIKGRE